jgi:hypothetical protein
MMSRPSRSRTQDCALPTNINPIRSHGEPPAGPSSRRSTWVPERSG